MASKEVTDREKSARAVVNSIETHAAALDEAMEARVKEHRLKGEGAVGAGRLLRLMGRALSSAIEALTQADHEHEKEIADDNEPRRRRDASEAALREAAIDGRDAVQACYGAPGLEALGMQKPAPADVSALATWVASVLKHIGEQGLVMPAPKRRTMKVDLNAMRAELGALLTPLRGALDDVAREGRELESTQAAKSRALAAYDQTFSETANLATALFKAAGMTEQAERVRPSKRKAGRTESDEDPVEDPTKPQ